MMKIILNQNSSSTSYAPGRIISDMKLNQFSPSGTCCSWRHFVITTHFIWLQKLCFIPENYIDEIIIWVYLSLVRKSLHLFLENLLGLLWLLWITPNPLQLVCLLLLVHILFSNDKKRSLPSKRKFLTLMRNPLTSLFIYLRCQGFFCVLMWAETFL